MLVLFNIFNLFFYHFRPSNVSSRVSFILDGNISFRISSNSSLLIRSFDFRSSNYSIFDHLFLSFGVIFLDSCTFVQLDCFNSIIISFGSVQFLNVYISKVSTFYGFLVSESSDSLYIFDGLLVEMLQINKTVTGSFMMCEKCTIIVKNSYFRYF